MPPALETVPSRMEACVGESSEVVGICESSGVTTVNTLGPNAMVAMISDGWDPFVRWAHIPNPDTRQSWSGLAPQNGQVRLSGLITGSWGFGNSQIVKARLCLL